jgi:hypothetical protein
MCVEPGHPVTCMPMRRVSLAEDCSSRNSSSNISCGHTHGQRGSAKGFQGVKSHESSSAV